MSKSDKYLGDIRTRIVGRQYYDGQVRLEEDISLEREPDNEHDPNAIGVMNQDSEQVGHLPRELAHWLAPLIDAGKVRAEGRCENPFPQLEHEVGTSMRLKTYLRPKGKAILQRVKSPTDELQALHEAVRRAFADARNYEDPDLVRRLGEHLSALASRGLLPETQLLLALFPHIANVIRRKQSGGSVESAKSFLSTLKLGRALRYKELTVYPLFGHNGHEPVYALLQDAIASKTAEVSEVDESGDIPSLRVTNRGSKPLLVPEGDILIGAKQDRVVNITIIVAANSQIILPVSCVEQGRWHHVSRNFDVAFSAPPRLRRDKVRSVQRNRSERAEAQSDQGEVWENVHAMLAMSACPSDTDSMADLYRARRDRLEDYRKQPALPEKAIGFVMASGNRILGVDLFDSPRTMSRVWPRVQEGYFIEALCDEDAEGKVTRKQAEEFLARLGENLQNNAEPIGEGTELFIDGKDVSGTGVWYQDRLCHLSAFCG